MGNESRREEFSQLTGLVQGSGSLSKGLGSVADICG